nr:hypothetical protein BCU35_02270 [Vibrio lentus]
MVQYSAFADHNTFPTLNSSHEHKFKANNQLSRESELTFNFVLNNGPRNTLDTLSKSYLNQIEIIDKNNPLYDENRVNRDAVKQEVAESIQYYLKHQLVLNPRFAILGGKVEEWCLEALDSSCVSPIAPFGQLANLDTALAPSGGFTLIVGKPNSQATIKTILQTVPGQRYTLSFDITGEFVKHPGLSYTYQPLNTRVSIGGEDTLITKAHPLIQEEFWSGGVYGVVDAPWDNNENGRNHWEKVELQFVATQEQTILSFTNLARTNSGQQTSPTMLTNIMVYDDVTADKGLQPGKVAVIATAGVSVAGLTGTAIYLARKGVVQNAFQALGYSSTTVGPGTDAMKLNASFDDMYEIMQGNGGIQALENYLTFPTREYGADYFETQITQSDLNFMTEMGFNELHTGLPANQVPFGESATYITKTVSDTTPIEEQTVLKFDSQEMAANFVRQLDSYLLREVDAAVGVREYVSSISVIIGTEDANAVVAEHESVIILHSASEFEVGNAGLMGVGEFVARFAVLRGFEQSIVDSLPFTYNSTSLAGVGWSSITADVNDTAALAIHTSYQAGMTAEEFSAAAMEALEVAGIVALL